MGHVKYDNPFLGDIESNFGSFVINVMRPFLESNGWSTNVANHSASNFTLIATHNNLFAFKLTNHPTMPGYIQWSVGDSYSSGVSLVNPCKEQITKLKSDSYPVSPGKDRIHLVCSSYDFWWFITDTTQEDTENGQEAMLSKGLFCGAGLLSKLGTYTGLGIFSWCSSENLPITQNVERSICVKMDNVGIGPVGNQWVGEYIITDSPAPSGSFLVLPESSQLFNNCRNAQTYNLSFLVTPITLYLKQGALDVNYNPIGTVSTLFYCGVDKIFKSGDIFDFNGKQYMAMNWNSLSTNFIAFKVN